MTQQFLCLFLLCLLQVSRGLCASLREEAGSDVTLETEIQEEIQEIHIPVSNTLYPRYQLHHETPTRNKRFASGNRRYRQKSRRQPSLGGDVVFSARRAFRLYFDFDYSSLSRTDIQSAHVIIYQTRPRRMSRRNRKLRSVADSQEVLGSVRQRRDARETRDLEADNIQKVERRSARVIMHQTIEYGEDVGSTQPTDMKLVDSRSRGWLAFDILPALKDWVADAESNQGLELWVVSSRPGRRAARSATSMKFVKPNSQRASFRPELVVKLKPSNTGVANSTT